MNERYIRGQIIIFTDPNNKNLFNYQENKPGMTFNGTLGKDVFNAFFINRITVIPNGSAKCNNGAYTCQNWRKVKSCNPEIKPGTREQGFGCLSRIIENGWQIDYY